MKFKDKIWFKQFKKGFTKSSFYIILAAAVIAAIVFTVLEISVRNGMITKIPMGYLVVEEEDFYTEATYKLYEMREIEADDVDYNIYMIGGSSARAMVTSDEELKSAIDERYSIDSSVTTLSIDLMNMLDFLQVVDNLPEGNGLVVLGLNNGKISFDSEFHRMYIRSDVYMDYLNNDEYVQKQKQKNEMKIQILGTHFFKKVLDKCWFDLSAYGKYPVYINIKQHKYDECQNYQLSNQIEGEIIFQHNYTQEDVEFFDKVLREIIDLAHSKNLDVLILHTPYNTEALGEELLEEDTKHMVFMELIDEITNDKNVSQFNFDQAFPANKDDFFDMRHIKTAEVREKYQDAFVETLDEFIN